MIDITATVKDHGGDALLLGLPGQSQAHLLGGLAVAGGALEALVQSGSGSQGGSVHIVDELRIDIRIAAVYIQAGSFRRAGDLTADAHMALLTHSVLIGFAYHDGTPPNYFLPPVLPAFRWMTSVEYLTPLPL